MTTSQLHNGAAPPNRDRALVDAALRDASRIAAGSSGLASLGVISHPAPDKFPGYDVVGEIRRGAQGVVFRAVQHRTQREVAIKVLRGGPFAGRRAQARFDREIQILARLKHANIVAIHDTGVVDDCFYYVMDYIAGQPPNEYAAATHLSVRDTLKLFEKICAAVGTAHLNGVIHRDLKPGNIRVDQHGEPHVLDFGLAKLTEAGHEHEHEPTGALCPTAGAPSLPGVGDGNDRLGAPSLPGVGDGTEGNGAHGLAAAPSLTETGQFVGSLPWASPEQADARPDDVDVRSDVYSLGVILYQMLTGEFPYPISRNAREMMTTIINVEPTPPSKILRHQFPTGDPKTLWHRFPTGEFPTSEFPTGDSPRPRFLPFVAPSLRRLFTGWNPAPQTLSNDIDTIVLKCLDKAPERRYQSAVELARDVRNYLSGEPIEAKRDSAAYVLRKQLSKHKLPVAVAIAFVLIITGGFATSLTFWRQTVAQRDAAEAEHQRAEANFQKARDAVDQMLIEVGSRDLADVPGMAPVQRALFEKALAFYQGFLEEKSDDQALRLETARAYSRVGNILGQLVRHDEANQYHQQAVEQFRTLADDLLDNPREKERLAETLNELASAYTALGRREEAAQTHREALTLWSAFATASPESAEYRKRQAECNYSLGHRLFQLGQSEEALNAHQRALRLYEQLVVELPDEPGNANALAQCRNDLGTFLSQLGRREEAVELMGQAALEFAALAAEFPDNHSYRADLSRVRFNLGSILHALNRFEESEKSFQESIELRQKLADDFPDRPVYRQKLADSLNNLANLLRAADRAAEAEPIFRRVIEVQEALIKRYPQMSRARHMLGGVLHNLAMTIDDRGGELSEVRALLERAIEHQQHAIELHSQQPWYRLFLRNHYDLLFDVLERMELFEQAEAAVRKALEISRKLAAEFPDRPQYQSSVASALYNLGNRLRKSDRYAEALASYEEARTIYEGLVAQSPDFVSYRYSLAITQHNLGLVYKKIGRMSEAEQAYRAALATDKLVVAAAPQRPAYRKSLATTHVSLANLLLETDRPAEAVQQWREGLADCPDAADMHDALAWFRATCAAPQLRNAGEALEHAARAVALDPDNGVYHNTLGIAHYRSDDFKSAAEALEKAIELYGGEANAWEWFFLAMIRWQLGDKERARELYDRAVLYMEKNEPDSAELSRFRAEAAQLLGIKK